MRRREAQGRWFAQHSRRGSSPSTGLAAGAGAALQLRGWRRSSSRGGTAPRSALRSAHCSPHRISPPLSSPSVPAALPLAAPRSPSQLLRTASAGPCELPFPAPCPHSGSSRLGTEMGSSPAGRRLSRFPLHPHPMLFPAPRLHTLTLQSYSAPTPPSRDGSSRFSPERSQLSPLQC